MLSTAIGIQFDVNDLSSSYEVIGSSDNYSFQYNLGKGSKLVDFAGETAQKTVSLKGNYGEFSIRVFAISDIGIRSEFIEDKISVSPPFFDETFTFSDIRIDNLPEEANVGRTIEIEPSLSGNLLAVNSEYINRDLEISWRLAPPVGHAKEGQSLGNELLSDKFLDNFSIQIRNTENGNVISTSDLNNSIALQQTLNTASVSDMMDAYTGFSFIISDNTLTKLTMDTEVFDSDNTYSSDRFTPGVAGKYMITAKASAINMVDNSYVRLAIYKNGSIMESANGTAYGVYTSYYNPGTNSGAGAITMTLNAIVDSDADDYFEIYGAKNDGGNTGGLFDKYFGAFRVIL